MKIPLRCFVFLAVLIAIFEVLLRAFAFIYPSLSFSVRSYDHFRGRPFATDYNNYYLNSRGFKDLEFEVKKGTNTFRIVALGDSFCFGSVPYDKHFLTLLEHRLNESSLFVGKKVEIYNMGIPGIGVDGYLSVLINEGLIFNPDMVVCFFYIGNDFADRMKKKENAFYIVSSLEFIFKTLPALGRNLNKIPIGNNFVAYNDEISFLSLRDFLSTERHRSQIFERDNSSFQAQYNYAFSYLKQIYRICTAKKVRLLIVLIPDEIQVNKELQQTIVSCLNKELTNFDFAMPNKKLRDSFSDLKIEFIDLLQYFTQKTGSVSLYKKHDTHWNIEGNKFASEVIFQKLKEGRLQ